ncbi:hypothetical protein HHK36_014827 [Tetracentron sinense]|uniref:Uncharacterized protein n=1 Tax=Tetracentron sinense TaxID=13715 RepID=A0A834Z9W3_TETSI|nr:hypothetical protein HHK36_014827 [Tetracentron sinense]
MVTADDRVWDEYLKDDTFSRGTNIEDMRTDLEDLHEWDNPIRNGVPPPSAPLGASSSRLNIETRKKKKTRREGSLDKLSAMNANLSLFFKQEMELSLIGLQNAGKTSLLNAIATGGYSEDMIPTVGINSSRLSELSILWLVIFRNLIKDCSNSENQVGFNMRKVTKGNVTIKLWDLGGQQRFRTMWERYCRGVSAILYVVDAADRDSVPISRSELHDLLTKPSLAGIPLLVLGNKIDKSEALSKQALVDQLGLESISDREVCCYMISCKDSINIDVVMDWLIKHSKTAE